jgi:hypothetical protein
VKTTENLYGAFCGEMRFVEKHRTEFRRQIFRKDVMFVAFC